MGFLKRISNGAEGSYKLAVKVVDYFTAYQLNLIIYFISCLVRFLLCLHGEYQDANFVVKYTDVDYFVYTDAARLVLEGRSPFERHTYRYTPLIAYLNTPNVLVHPACGKVFFCLFDIACGAAIQWILRKGGRSSKSAVLFTTLWLFNPMVVAISTRGSADCLITLLVLWFIWAVQVRRHISAAILLGVSTHIKIYPIIYALPALAALNPDYLSFLNAPNRKTTPGRRIKAGQTTQEGKFKISHIFKLSRVQLEFAFSSAFTFLLLTLVFYLMYGWEFLYEGYLYHFIRKDHRHNFSLYFNLMYLTSEIPSKLTSVITFVPQMVTTFLVGIVYSKNKFPMGCFLQTIIFVAFNKVLTSQYFIWWMALLPLAAGTSVFSWKRSIALASFMVAFFVTQLHWLFWAYRLEFLGLNVYTKLLWASIGLCYSQLAIGCFFMRCSTSSPSAYSKSWEKKSE